MWRKEDMNEEEIELKQAVEENRGTQSLRSYATSIGSDASYISQVCNDQDLLLMNFSISSVLSAA